MGNTNDKNSKKDDSTNLPLNKKKRWGVIKSDLKDALNTWDRLEKKEAPLSQEEQQLNNIKSIINQLKDKLEQF
ncbi:MAG: hypothetical protein H7256_05045 [Bdellovibrio sp.]|nr:hypothetical protein [Bdellovibrio sp.]